MRSLNTAITVTNFTEMTQYTLPVPYQMLLSGNTIYADSNIWYDELGSYSDDVENNITNQIGSKRSRTFTENESKSLSP